MRAAVVEEVGTVLVEEVGTVLEGDGATAVVVEVGGAAVVALVVVADTGLPPAETSLTLLPATLGPDPKVEPCK